MEKFTTVEQFQATRESREVRADKKPITPVIQMLKGKPELQEAIALNPYTAEEERKEVRELTNGEFSDQSLAKAAILAEPAREYEEFFQSLDKSEKKEELYNQIDLSADMVVRMVKKAEELGDKIFEMPSAELYEIFSETAFETNDPAEINQKFAQNQRRGFRLAIENFIEDQKSLTQDMANARKNPKEFLERVTRDNFTYSIEADFSPFGLVFYLEPEDYAVAAGAKNIQEISSAGGTLFSRCLSPILSGKIIIINKMDYEHNPKDPEDMASTRNHELHHASFNSFFSTREFADPRTITDKIPRTENRVEHMAYAKEIISDFLNGSKDEIIAYASNNEFVTSLNALVGDKYELQLKEIEQLIKRSPISKPEKTVIMEIYSKESKNFAKQFRRCQWLAETLIKTSRKEGSETSPDKAMALLQITPAEQWPRLQKYFDKSEKSLEELYQETIEMKTAAFAKDAEVFRNSGSGTVEWDTATMRLISEDRNFIEIHRPTKALPIILDMFERNNYPQSALDMLEVLVNEGDQATLAQGKEIEKSFSIPRKYIHDRLREGTSLEEAHLEELRKFDLIENSLKLKNPEQKRNKKSFFSNVSDFFANLQPVMKQPGWAMSLQDKLKASEALDSVETMVGEGNLTTAELNVAEEAAEAATTLGNKEIAHEANEIIDDIKVLEEQEKIKNL
jgi:hypothetical protein